MAAPVAYNNTTTQLPDIPKSMKPPERAEVLKRFAHGGIRFVMGKHDTASSLFHTLYPSARTPQGRNLLGGESHLHAYLTSLPGGYPKPGAVVEIPNFDDYVGKAAPAVLQRAVELIERQQSRRCNDHASRATTSSERLASVIAPRLPTSGITLRASAPAPAHHRWLR